MTNKIRIMQEVPEPKEPVDITHLYIQFSQQYRNVFAVQLGEEVFIYRALGRSEFKEILEDTRFDDYKKEELICSQCLLYPDPDTYDWDDKPAGLPTELKKHILKNSYLDSVERRSHLHDYYRSEMYNIDNQITCIINEAFPNIDIEEIEQWDVEKTTKYLSRAEWKLQTLHGLPLDQGVAQSEPQEIIQEPPKKKKEKTIRGQDPRKSKLTPEKMKEREEFLRKFPQFAGDNIEEAGGIDGLAQDDVSDLSPALRTGW